MSSGTATARNAESCKGASFGQAKFRASRGYEHESEVIAPRRLLDGTSAPASSSSRGRKSRSAIAHASQAAAPYREHRPSEEMPAETAQAALARP